MENLSKLVNGDIPPNTECPYKSVCNYDKCRHLGVEHTVSFSCALARLHDITHRRARPLENKS